MRLHLKTSPNREQVPFDYQAKLVGTLHKWLGQNKVHDALSLYSFSWLQEGKARGGGLDFRRGANWFISSPDKDLILQLVIGIQNDPNIAYGLKVEELRPQQAPRFGKKHCFRLGSPVFIKRPLGSGHKFYYHQDPESSTFMTETLRHKLRRAGQDDASLKVYFDPDYASARTKKIRYRGVENRASMCPIIIEGQAESLAFAWEVGVGNSTGIGFGSLV